MIELNKTYRVKEEFLPLLNISLYQIERRKEDLLEWLKNFFDYEFFDGKPLKIKINEIYGEYKPLPRKLPKQDELNQKKIEDYEKFTIKALGNSFKPNSKARIAKEAITSFGYVKYGHNSIEAIARRYITPPFDQYGETNNHQLWVWYKTYEPLEEDILLEWRQILEEEHISEKDAANAFYKQQ